MGIKQEMQAISLEIKSIEESKSRIKLYLQELNKHNPFSVGETLVGNDYRHQGKEFIVDKTYAGVGNYTKKNAEHNLGELPTCFIAEGSVLKKDGVHSVYRTTRYVDIGDNHE